MNKYEIELLKKINSKENLTEDEIRYLLDYEIERKEGTNRRWSCWVTSIVEIGCKTFEIGWDKGLTECQENEYPSQPIEVQKKTYEKTITVTEWIPVVKESEDK